jgi:hypothetical protein
VQFADIDPTIREWLCAREMLRRLGFQPDEIVFAVKADGQVVDASGYAMGPGRPVILLLLKTQGREFTWIIGPTDLRVESIQQAFDEACEFWNRSLGDDPSWERFFKSSQAGASGVQLLVALQGKGIRIPKENWR